LLCVIEVVDELDDVIYVFGVWVMCDVDSIGFARRGCGKVGYDKIYALCEFRFYEFWGGLYDGWWECRVFCAIARFGSWSGYDVCNCVSLCCNAACAYGLVSTHVYDAMKVRARKRASSLVAVPPYISTKRMGRRGNAYGSISCKDLGVGSTSIAFGLWVVRVAMEKGGPCMSYSAIMGCSCM
jgi:hypothetical protein